MRGVLAGGCVMLGLVAWPAGAMARTKVVYAGGPPAFQSQIQQVGGGVDNFLINRVVINVGDTVNWSGESLSGGFHTVDIPEQGGADQPLIVPTGSPVPSTVIDAAGNPFWFDGKLSGLTFNPALFGPSGGNVYNGSARVDSGLPLGPPSDFKVTFTKAGEYQYFCDVHPGMRGWVIVRPVGQPVPSPEADAKTLRASEEHYLDEAQRLAGTQIHGARVQLGASSRDGVESFAMFPSTLTVKPNTTVTFFMSQFTRETHTATFGSEGYLNGLASSFTGPTGAIDPVGAYPSSPSDIVLTPTSHSNGFANVGALDQDPLSPLPSSGKIDFTTPGVYHFICLIHPFMHGTVIVK